MKTEADMKNRLLITGWVVVMVLAACSPLAPPDANPTIIKGATVNIGPKINSASIAGSAVTPGVIPEASGTQTETTTPVAFEATGTTGTLSPAIPVLNPQVGIAFTVPAGFNLDTEANPGGLASFLSAAEPYILVNPAFDSEKVEIRFVEGFSDSALVAYKKLLSDNPDTPLPGYKRISLASIAVGRGEQINAVEHIYQIQGNGLQKVRSITFVIGTRGYNISCTTSLDRFDLANTGFFEPFLGSLAPAE
jgi:hypothetical protein